MKPRDLAAVPAPGWAWAAILADGVRRDYSGVTCYTGGQKGHTSTVCRKKGAQKAAPAADGAKARTSTEERACYICGKKGHLFRNCPSKVSPVTEAAKAPAKGNQASSYGTLEYQTKEAYLKIQVNGRYYNCLLETGSDVTIFPFAMVKGRKLHPTTTVLKAANGMAIPCWEKLPLTPSGMTRPFG